MFALAVIVASPFALAADVDGPPCDCLRDALTLPHCDLFRDALTLLALVLVAEWVHVLLPGAFRLALLSLAAVASILFVSDLPAVAFAEPSSASPSGEWLIQIVAAAILLVLLGKLVLLHRLAPIANGREFRRQADPQRLLPGQRLDLYDLCRATLGRRLDDPGQLVQLIGRWGEGKSFVIHHLESYLANPVYDVDPEDPKPPEPLGPERSQVASVVIDVWKHETEPDLHLALIEEILSEPRFLMRFGWLRAPLSILVGRYVRNGLLRLSLGSQKLVAAEVPFTPPRLPWQRSYERLVGHARKRGRRTMIVLDEIDRCSPAMAQRTISMTRRSLDLPGVTVVLCYVDQLIRYKAFNPLVDDVLADLGSTMEAVIFASQIRSTQGSWAPNSIRSWWSSRGSPSNVPPTATYDANKGAETDQPALATALKRAYEGESLTARYQLEESSRRSTSAPTRSGCAASAMRTWPRW